MQAEFQKLTSSMTTQMSLRIQETRAVLSEVSAAVATAETLDTKLQKSTESTVAHRFTSFGAGDVR